MGAVEVKVAPDTAKRAVMKLAAPSFLAAIVAGVMMFVGAGEHEPFLWGAAATILLAVGAWAFFVIRRSRELIVFRAGRDGLSVRNALAMPKDVWIRLDDLAVVHLRRTSLLTEAVCYELRVVRRTSFIASPETVLLVSPSFETLDKIGRTLCAGLGLPEPVGGNGGWWSAHPGAAGGANAEPSLF
jgi:hypothetical protein